MTWPLDSDPKLDALVRLWIIAQPAGSSGVEIVQTEAGAGEQPEGINERIEVVNQANGLFLGQVSSRRQQQSQPNGIGLNFAGLQT